MKKILPICLGISLVFFTGVSQAQTTVSLTPVQDNTLFESATGNLSGGADDHVFVGNTNNGGTRRAVLKFNLSTIPAGATITGATLTLTMNQTISGAQPVALHRVNANWGEGTSVSGSGGGGGGTATTNSATWIHSFYPGTNWATPGGDFVATASATTSVSGSGNYTWTGAQLLTDVQSMFANAAGNHGWILIGNEATNGSAKRFGSRENASPSARPSLSVTYTLPCIAPTVPTLTATQTTLCAGNSTNITATGTLNSATAWHLYSGSCGGTAVASNTTGIFTVSPTTTTTYFVRGQGGCVTPGSCAQTTITVNPTQSAAFNYGTGSFCAGGPNAVPTITGTPGGTFALDGIGIGLFINASTGVIDMSLTMPGTYPIIYTTPGPCQASSTVTVTVNAAQTASISYPANSYCQNAANPLPTLTGTGGGTYSGTSGLVVNATSGEVNLAASTAGTHTVTYSTTGACAATATATLTLSPADAATISYSSGSYCQSAANPTPTITGTTGGTFTSTPAGLSLNGTTGEINLAASTPGSYTVTYSTAGACPASSQATIAITATGSAAFAYAAANFCLGGSNPSPTITGTSGGTFSGTTGLAINATTGEIDLGASTAGTHTVTYSTSGACTASATATVTLNTTEDAGFSYNATSFCQNGINPVPVISGTPGGSFSHNSFFGFFMDAATGVIDLTLSMPGNYLITYTTPGSCSSDSTLSITINPTFAENASATICNGDSYTFGTQTLTNAGTFTETFASAAGCDSVVTLTLSVSTVNTGVTLNGQTLQANQAGATYQWYNCTNSVPVPGATGQSFTPTATGQYMVLVTQGSCSEFSTCISVTVTSTEEELANAVQVYPNPAQDKLTIQVPEAAKAYTLELVNVVGQSVLRQQFTRTNQAEIALTGIPAGSYVLRIETNGIRITRSLLVVK